MSKKIFNSKTEIKLPLPSVLFYIFMFFCDRSILTVITLACAALHELGHFAAARLCNVGVVKMTLYPFGADMKLDTPLRSYRKDLFISSAGIAVNLALAALSLTLSDRLLEHMMLQINLALAATNLIPIDGLDGGGILRAILNLVFSEEIASTVLNITSFFGLLIMWGTSIHIFFVSNGSPSLFVISCVLFACLYLKETPHGSK